MEKITCGFWIVLATICATGAMGICAVLILLGDHVFPAFIKSAVAFGAVMSMLVLIELIKGGNKK